MTIKDDTIRVTGMRPELLLAMIIANEVYASHHVEFVITSLLDGKHSETSLHYTGCAFDCRIYGGDINESIVKDLRQKLNHHYDVVLEGNHIHVEFQPRY